MRRPLLQLPMRKMESLGERCNGRMVIGWDGRERCELENGWADSIPKR